MFPIEFTFPGPPLSHQSKNKRRKANYKANIAKEATDVLPSGFTPTNDGVLIKITYFYEDQVGDVDNIIKPIQDALIGIIYIDDNQIVDTRSCRKNINGSYQIRNVSSVILNGFSKGNDFVHVFIDKYIESGEL